MAQRPKHLNKSNNFPRLAKQSNWVTSDADVNYNCIAFAAGITNRKLWPNFHPDYFWPPGIPRMENLASFIKFYESYGYAKVNDGSGGKYVKGVEKIAIYADRSGVPTHAAKQVGPNRWASKLGDWYDIEHILGAVSGGAYGEIVTFMQRPKT
jgi:hypothetical protein